MPVSETLPVVMRKPLVRPLQQVTADQQTDRRCPERWACSPPPWLLLRLLAMTSRPSQDRRRNGLGAELAVVSQRSVEPLMELANEWIADEVTRRTEHVAAERMPAELATADSPVGAAGWLSPPGCGRLFYKRDSEPFSHAPSAEPSTPSRTKGISI